MKKLSYKQKDFLYALYLLLMTTSLWILIQTQKLFINVIGQSIYHISLIGGVCVLLISIWWVTDVYVAKKDSYYRSQSFSFGFYPFKILSKTHQKKIDQTIHQLRTWYTLTFFMLPIVLLQLTGIVAFSWLLGVLLGYTFFVALSLLLTSRVTVSSSNIA